MRTNCGLAGVALAAGLAAGLAVDAAPVWAQLCQPGSNCGQPLPRYNPTAEQRAAAPNCAEFVKDLRTECGRIRWLLLEANQSVESTLPAIANLKNLQAQYLAKQIAAKKAAAAKAERAAIEKAAAAEQAKKDAEAREAEQKRLAEDDARKKREPLASLPQQQQLAAAAAAAPVTPDRRVALVIGNSHYEGHGQLKNPQNDATAIAVQLRQLGFAEVALKHDLGLQELTRALREFGDKASGADWAVLYYAGHGIEIGGVNYLLPVDAKLKDARDAEDEAVSLARVLSRVEGAKKLRLVILDACRDNPFGARMTRTASTRSIGRGLARIEPPRGILVAYAARDGELALDGDDGNSPFAKALVKHLAEPQLEINMLFRKVRDMVHETTGRRQEPYTYGSLPAEEFIFNMRVR